MQCLITNRNYRTKRQIHAGSAQVDALPPDREGLLRHTYSFLGVETYKQVATEKIPVGAVTVKMLFAADEDKPGTAGTVTLHANGKVIGEGKWPTPCLSRFPATPGWTSAGTTAWSSTWTTRTSPVPLHRDSAQGHLRPQAGYPRR
jgi:hypothetical protein